ncbi:MAG: hypothetical protein AABZ80_06265 [Gemmatimonadota bacterium]
MTRRALAALLSVVPVLAGAQDRERCFFDNTPQTRQTSNMLESGQRNTFFGGGIVVRCPSRDLRLQADSLESYGDEGRIFLVGDVHYDEPRLSLTSDYLTYRQLTEHIFASGNVVAKSPTSGSTLRGPALEYYRAMSDRPATKIIAIQRPTVALVQKDSSGSPSDTLVVVSDRITMIGDSLVYAGGKVVITRPEVEARGDSVLIDSERELMVLMRTPSITGKKDRPFTLAGVRIEMTTQNRKLSRVLAKGQGKATSQDMTLSSDTIDLRIAGDLLQRAIAWGPGRARIISATQQIAADSIDVLLPNQRIRELHAVRGAAAEGQPDTTRFRADTVDWLRGDTIVAKFDSAAPRDTARAAQLRELVARGGAKSYYHMAPADTTIRKAAVNYVNGRQIVVAFAQRRASKVTVVGKASGVYVEPKPDTKAATKTTPAATASPRPPTPKPE